MDDNFAVLKLDVNYMKHSMITAIRKHHLDVEKAINKACDDYINGGELDKLIQNAFQDAVKEEVKRYFSYGEGSKGIQEVITKGLSKYFGDK